MVLPVYQKYGYGRFLIEFSYLLSKREELAGTPEKPLSDLGRLSYESYWKFKILEYVNEHKNGKITIEDISKSTGMNFVDIAATLQKNDLLKYRVDKSGLSKYEIVMNEQLWSSLKRPKIVVNEEALRWTPLVLSHQLNNESLDNEDDASNLSDALNDQKSPEVELKSGPVNSFVNNNDLVLKKKKKRKWRNKTGFDDRKPKKRNKTPLTNGKSSTVNHVNQSEETNSQDKKASIEDEQTEEDSIEEDFRNDTDNSIDHLNRSVNGDNTQDFLDDSKASPADDDK